MLDTWQEKQASAAYLCQPVGRKRTARRL